MTSDRSKDEANAQDATRDEASSSQETSSQSGWAALSSGQVTMGTADEEDEEETTSNTAPSADTRSAASQPVADQQAASSQPAAEPQREQPVSGMVSQRPALPPSPVMALGDAMRGFLRGMLPPQGLDVFAEEVRTTASQVGNMYANLFRFQVESVERAISETRLGRNQSLEDHERTEQK